MGETRTWEHLPLSNHNALVQEICESITTRYRQSEDNDRVKTSTEQFEQRYITRSTTWTGDEKMENIMKLCSNIPGYTYSYFQRKFNRMILECMSPLIFGNAPAHEFALHLRKYNMEPPDTQFAYGNTARRGGKTDAMTSTAAAMLASIPNVQILYFSLFKPTCQLACATAVKWLRDWGYQPNIKTKSLQITFHGEQSNDIRTLTFITGQNPNVTQHYQKHVLKGRVILLPLFIIFHVNQRDFKDSVY
jgi:hypothetical protein